VITLSELQRKEIIDVEKGLRLGHLDDLRINPSTGVIEEIIIISRSRKGGFFAQTEEIIIQWRQIRKIGEDVILVNRSYEPPLYLETPRKRHSF